MATQINITNPNILKNQDKPLKHEPANKAVGAANEGLWGRDGFTFADFLDIINPFQQIPILSSIYRAVTGDEISPGARMAGGGLFGGPFGFAAGVMNSAIAAETGNDLGGNLITALTGNGLPSDNLADSGAASLFIEAASGDNYAPDLSSNLTQSFIMADVEALSDKYQKAQYSVIGQNARLKVMA